MKLFRFYITRTPKSLHFKDQSTKAKFFVLKSSVDYLERRVESQDEMVRELLERVYRLEIQSLPKCGKCGQKLPNKKECC